MATKYNTGVSEAVISVMVANKGKTMDETVKKIMALPLGLPVHRARAYYRTFVRTKAAPGKLPVKGAPAKVQAKSPRKARKPSAPAEQPTAQ